MNERLKELAEQASHQSPDGYPVTIPYSKDFVKKFAELIVRECALTLESITVPVSEYYEDFDNGYNKALLTGSTVIKKRFGVKE